MAGPAPAGLPILLAVLAVDLWVYADAKARWERGDPVVVSFGSFTVDTPVAWLLACLVLWILFVPLYVAVRDPSAR